MKDTVITAAQKKKEIIILASCFAIAVILNIIGILKYNTPWKELVTQLHVVLLVTAVLYAIQWFFRGLYLGVRYLVKK
jgi:hypothetical protein